MKTAIVYGNDFPFNGVRPNMDNLNVLHGLGEIIHPDELNKKLKENIYATIVNLHGSYFPKDAWNEILSHVRSGRGLVSVGASPFTMPVTRSDGYRTENAQTSYHRLLNIENIYAVNNKFASFECNKDFSLGDRFAKLFDGGEISEFSVMFTHKNDTPSEHGTSGPMEANIHPLIYALSENNLKIAAPVVLIENTKAAFAGGNWVFYNQNIGTRFWENDGAMWLKQACAMTSLPVCEVIVRPELACYRENEQPMLALQYQVLGYVTLTGSIKIEVLREGKAVFEKMLIISADKNIRYETIPVPITVGKGYYEITAAVCIDGRERIYTSGFWGYDRALLETGDYLCADGDYFSKGGKTFLINGMTYMANDVHRRYLLIPNVSVWMKDFDLMKGADINLVRTGFWTHFRQFMFTDGIPNDQMLRAIDAFVSVAKHFDIEVVFNFFAFTPETWEGVNPYLDPVSVEAQKRFVSAVAARHANTKNLSWDLINEPSVCNPKKIFSGPKPNYDEYELTCWRVWLKERYKTADAMCEALNLSGMDFDSIPLPEDCDFTFTDEVSSVPYPPKFRAKTLLAGDYTLFQNHVFDGWACEMKQALNVISPEKLVTVGQDHATSGRRAHPFFHGQFMDYTTVHTWWQMDDLYWDAAFVKIPGKPAIVQETGLMYVESANESYQRSETDLRDVLERKVAYAYSANTAGVIPWVLNTNIYMLDVNEVHIGLLRADLTEKPEFLMLREVYGFIARNSHLFGKKLTADVHMVFPFANSYSSRAYANIATRRAARILTSQLNTAFFGCGDYQLDKLPQTKLLIYPCPRVIPNDSWKEILRLASGGATVLLTGAVNFDEHWKFVSRSKEAFGVSCELKTVQREETVMMDGNPFRTVFDGQLIGWAEKEIADASQPAQIYTANIGAGKILWCPLPVEMNKEDEIIKAMYEKAMSDAGITNEIEYKQGDVPGVFIRRLGFENGTVYVAISEDGTDRDIEFADKVNNAHITFKLLAGRSAFIAADAAGKVIDTLIPM